MRSFRKKSSNTKTIFAAVIMAGIAAFYYLVETTQATTPAIALAKARDLIADGKANESSTFIEIAKQDKALHSWLTLEIGKSLQSQGKLAESLRAYNKIPESSPASLDAKLQLLSIEIGKKPKQQLLAEIEDLTELFVRTGRSDLLRGLNLLAAEQLLKTQNIKEGFRLICKIRDRFARTKEATSALELRDLYINDDELSNEELKKEAARFLKENNAERALELLELLYSRLPKSSAESFEFKLFEEKVLRRLKRHEEADRLLLLISADGPPEIADNAMLLIAKKAWNINNHDRAITFINNGIERFPGSKLISEMRYVKARILEELQQYPEAKEVYIKASKASSKPEYGARSLLRVAWLYYQSDNMPFAASFFQQAAAKSSRALKAKTNSPKTRRELREILNEARFWEAFIAKSLTKDELTVLKKRPITLDKLAKVLNPNNIPSYHAVAAHSLLGASEPIQALGKLSTGTCQRKLPADLLKLIAKLHQGELKDLIKYEIYWHFRTEPNQKKTLVNNIELAIALANSDLPHESIKRSQAILFELIEGKNTKAASKCLPELIASAYPLGHLDTFKKTARKNGLPPSLLLAIAHTESSFDPKALSIANAKGLMQLLTKTAAQEGLQKNEDLFDPEVNIRLGSKHFRRLMNVYQDELIYSIAAYNAGGAAVNRWKTRYKKISPNAWAELIGYPETKRYVRKVILAQYFYEFLLSH